MDIKINTVDFYKKMATVGVFEKANGRMPNYITFTIDGKEYNVELMAYIDAHNRINKFLVAERRTPDYVTMTSMTPIVRNIGPIQKGVEGTLKRTFDTFTQFYNYMLGRGYLKYFNDVKTLAEEIAVLAKLNCADATQLAVLLAREMGYSARFVHVKCVQSGEGHIYGEIRGKEFGANWVKFDMAACMSIYSKYDLGKVWCQDAKPISYNDPWLESDDGRT